MKISDTKSNVIVLGSGGHTSVLLSSLKRSGINVLGLTDPEKELGARVFGLEVLGTDEVIFSYPADDIELVNGVGEVQFSSRRREITARMKRAGYKFTTVIDPTAIVSDDVLVGEGVQIMAGVIVQPRVKIGPFSILNTGVIIDHDSEVGSECHVCPGTTITGNVVVGDRTFIGSGSTVIPDKTIGSDVVIGAGSVIVKNVPNNVTMVQNITKADS